MILKITGGLFDYEKIKNEIASLEKETENSDFWSRGDKDNILETLSNLKNKIKLIDEVFPLIQDLESFTKMDLS